MTGDENRSLHGSDSSVASVTLPPQHRDVPAPELAHGEDWVGRSQAEGGLTISEVPLGPQEVPPRQYHDNIKAQSQPQASVEDVLSSARRPKLPVLLAEEPAKDSIIQTQSNSEKSPPSAARGALPLDNQFVDQTEPRNELRNDTTVANVTNARCAGDDIETNVVTPARESLSMLEETDALDSGWEGGEQSTTDSDGSIQDSGWSQRQRHRRPQWKRAANEIIRLFTSEKIGCDSDSHEDEWSDRCRHHEGTPCYNLAQTCSFTGRMMKPIGGLRNIGLLSETFPNPSQVGRSAFLPAEELRHLFEGRMDEQDLPDNICIRLDHNGGVAATVEYDFDAFIVLMDSFDGFREATTLHLSFVKQTAFNISTDIHLKLPVEGRAKRSRLEQVQYIPHLWLGTVEGFHNSTLFVVFPLLYSDDTKSSWLSDKHSKLFFDAWLVACRRHVSLFVQQYLPSCSASAEGRAKAKGIEHRSALREQTLKSITDFSVPASALQQAWKELHRRIEDADSGLGVFRGAQILVNTKNTKLHEPAPSMLQAIERFRAKLDVTFDRSVVQYYGDLGKKIVPGNTLMHRDTTTSREVYLRTPVGHLEQHNEDERTSSQLPHTYLWRACCLDTIYQNIRRDLFDGQRGIKQTYYNGYLRDATTLTVVPPAKAWIRRAGLLYIQFYNPVKEVECEQQIRPFDLPTIPNLALATDLLVSPNLSKHRGTIVKSYCGGKIRIRRDYPAARSTVFGLRMECRIDGRVIDEAHEALVGDERSMGFEGDESIATPTYAWCIPTRVWCDFMEGNFHKITSLVEMITLINPRSGITRDSSELLFAVYLYLQGLSNCNPARKNILWKESRDSDTTGREYGLNLEHSIREYGFGWIAPLVDWYGLRLMSHVQGRLIGCQQTIGSQYQGAMRLAQDQRTILEVCHDHIRTSKSNSQRMVMAMKTAAHFVLRQYRRDVLSFFASKGELSGAYQSEINQDSAIFCESGLRTVMTGARCYVNNGKVCGWKDAEEFFRWIMDTAPHSRRRKSFDGPQQKEWRRMLFTMKSVVEGNVQREDLWYKHLRAEFAKYMFSIPYPDPNGTFVEMDTKTKTRKFFAAGYENGQWRCLGNQPRLDFPPAYPDQLRMSPMQVDEYLRLWLD